LTPVVAPAALGIVGLSAAGPVAGQFPPQDEAASNPSEPLGSIAAGVQAGIGNVAAGSAYAAAQSIAMGGAIPTVVSAFGGGLGASIGTAAAWVGRRNKDSRKENPTDEDATGGDAAGKEETSVVVGEGPGGPAGEGAARTGRKP